MGRQGELIRIAYDQPFEQPLTLCLGFFDSLHLGHRMLFDHARMTAEKYGCETAVFTFENNPFAVLGQPSLQVLTMQERCYRLQQAGIRHVMTARFDEQFAAMSAAEFVERLLSGKQIRAIVVGNDYTFGNCAQGTAQTLRQMCERVGVQLEILDMKRLPNGEKIASRRLREAVRAGDVEQIREQLGAPYPLIGKVIRGRGDGASRLFATANVEYPAHKEKLAPGVYETRVTVDGVPLKAVTNVGGHPTMGDMHDNVESHILHYRGDLYGRELLVEFYRRLRDIQKFDSVEALRAQIASDIRSVETSKER